MHDPLYFHVGKTSQAAARIYISLPAVVEIKSAVGKCVGPYCEFAKTLPTEFAFQKTKHPATGQDIVETQIIDPCYWNPALPFTYQLELQIETDTGEKIAIADAIGIRQWYGNRNSFFLENKRTVLRGCQCSDLSEETIHQAREQELALLIEPAEQSFYAAANQFGVALIIDLRNRSTPQDHLRQFNWVPSVFAAILSGQQISQLPASRLPRQCLLMQHLSEDAQLSDIQQTSIDAVAVDLTTTQPPANWLTEVELPVVAIRRGLAHDQMQRPRQACDKLQADLAPEFDLAGYFVSP